MVCLVLLSFPFPLAMLCSAGDVLTHFITDLVWHLACLTCNKEDGWVEHLIWNPNFERDKRNTT